MVRRKEAFLRSGEILSARANPLSGSIVIRHAPAFTLSTTSLARFDLVCAVPSGTLGQTGPQCGAADLCGLLAELCPQVVLHRVARPQMGSTLLPAN